MGHSERLEILKFEVRRAFRLGMLFELPAKLGLLTRKIVFEIKFDNSGGNYYSNY